MQARSPQPPRNLDLFEPASDCPAGFAYQADLITPREEEALLDGLAGLPLQPFNFQGHLANRRVASFGYRYDYADRRLHEAPPIPDFLHALIDKAARFTSHVARDFVHVLINEYRPGAGIGWHRDKAHFGDVVGVSLGAPCTLRFRLQSGERWIRRNAPLAARSAYLLTGPARQDWEHSIAPLAAHRFSITLRTLAG